MIRAPGWGGRAAAVGSTLALALGLVGLAGPSRAWAQGGGAERAYRFLATAESDDQVVLAEFKPCPAGAATAGAGPTECGARILRTYPVGLWPSETEGPHGVVPSADGRAFFVSLAHGKPFGFLQKIDLESGRETGLVQVGMFAATVDLSPVTGLVYVVNFNFEDPNMEPSSLSIIDGATMAEIARPETCRMPHGSRLNPQGTRHYSGCMMNDLLVEVDARTFAVSRAFRLVAGREGPVELGAPAESAAPGAHEGMGPEMSNVCSPTWAQPSADGAKVYVACNKSAEIAEVDVASWRMTRRWKTPPAPYNLAVTPDGRLLLATQKGPGTTSVWDVATASLLADLPGTRKIASGIAVSADSRYAFVTLEGIGGDPGTVDVLDLQRLAKVASLELGKQAGGIAMMPGS